MNRLLVGSLVAATLGVVLSACGDDVSGYIVEPNCSAYASCDTCTPVLGCGWCMTPGGAGVCVSDPDYCPTQEFSWTWDIDGCRVPADASVGPTVDGSSGDATSTDGPREAIAADAGPRRDAARD